MSYTDYTPEYLEVLRRLTPTERWRAAMGLYWSARRLRAAALRSKHPDWTAEQIKASVREHFLYARD